jgi:hypothetical protein
MAGAPAPGPRVSTGLPLCVHYPAPLCINVINDYKNNEYLNLTVQCTHDIIHCPILHSSWCVHCLHDMMFPSSTACQLITWYVVLSFIVPVVSTVHMIHCPIIHSSWCIHCPNAIMFPSTSGSFFHMMRCPIPHTLVLVVSTVHMIYCQAQAQLQFNCSELTFQNYYTSATSFSPPCKVSEPFFISKLRPIWE